MTTASLSAEVIAEKTYTWERIRSLFSGFIELMWQPGSSIALLIAIRYYDAGSFAKGLISASGFIGFLLTPLTLSLFAHSRQPIHRAMSLLFVITSAFLFLTPLLGGIVAFTTLVTLAHISMVQYVPMYTELYSTHFTTDQRGHRIGTVFIIAGGVSIIGNVLIGYLLDFNIQLFKPIVGVMALCCLGSAWCISHIPSQPLALDKVGNPFRNLSLIWTDRLFGWLLLSWMILGFGNLMTLPLRIEYMASPRYGINADNQTIFVICGALPLCFRLLSTRVLGKLFDRWNLVTLRIFLNLLFLCSVLFFFNSRNLWVLGISMAFLGTAMGGGRIAWSLWVTKLAPPGHASAYMSIHMLSTGLRGTIAPFVGFALMEHLQPQQVASIGTTLILLSTLLFLPARPHMEHREAQLLSP
jgi:MFS family permease